MADPAPTPAATPTAVPTVLVTQAAPSRLTEVLAFLDILAAAGTIVLTYHAIRGWKCEKAAAARR